MKKLIACLLALVMTVALAACGGSPAPSSGEPSDPGSAGSAPESKKLKVGIVQIMEHPSLDEIRQSFLDEMEALGYGPDQVDYDYQSAQSEPANVTSICQKFVGDGVDLIVAIATPSAQGASAATDQIPIIFSAVTDPVAAELVDSLAVPGGNCTGTSDAIPADRIFSLADELTPGIKTFGFIYNLSEPNSVSVITEAKAYLDSKNVAYQEATITNVSELTTAAESLIGKVDAIFSPIDNTVASGMVTLAEIATSNKIPVYVAADSMVADGGLATVGVNYTQLGKQTAQMAKDVLEGADPASMPVQVLNEYAVAVNAETAAALGVDVSKYTA